MNEALNPGAYGELAEPTTLKLQRLLPGPIERVWTYLVDSDLRAQWLAGGVMQPAVGTAMELVWRNDELTQPPGTRPPGFGAEHRMASSVTVFDPPHRLAFTWGNSGDVSFDLETRGQQVLLTLVHRRIPERATRVMIGAGWHTHLDLLQARLSGTATGPFWDGWLKLRAEYEQRLPA